MLLESGSKGRDTDRLMVEDAWDWKAIERAYGRYDETLLSCPVEGHWRALLTWARHESRQWAGVMELDPLLPKVLHPWGYEGPEVWKRRRSLLRIAEQRISGMIWE